MIRTINETVSFTQEVQEEDLDIFKTAGSINAITIKSYINTIDNLTVNFIAFLRALDFMDCQIIEQFENQLIELKERSAFEVSKAQEDTETSTEDDDEEGEEVPLVCGMNKEFTFGNGSEDFTFVNNNTGFMFGGASYPSASKDAIVFS
jgi:hypothetical protein